MEDFPANHGLPEGWESSPTGWILNDDDKLSRISTDPFVYWRPIYPPLLGEPINLLLRSTKLYTPCIRGVGSNFVYQQIEIRWMRKGLGLRPGSNLLGMPLPTNSFQWVLNYIAAVDCFAIAGRWFFFFATVFCFGILNECSTYT